MKFFFLFFIFLLATKIVYAVELTTYNCERIHTNIKKEGSLSTNITNRGEKVILVKNIKFSKDKWGATTKGTVKFINVPGGRGVRIDTALYTNYKVNPHYDSLILKIVSKGKDRNESMSIMKRALDEIIIDGINTNIELHKWILNQNDFIDGIYNTNWLEKNISKFN